MRIALIGFGNVGKAFLHLLKNKKDNLEKNGISLEIISILNSQGGIYDAQGISLEDFLHEIELNKECNKFSNFDSTITLDYIIENGNIDAAVLLTPTNKDTGEPGLTYIKKILAKGISVITGDKGPILLEYKHLKKLAQDNNCTLAFGCTTGGALPSINSAFFDLAGSEILEVRGVLNGTSNYIINEMEDNNLTFEKALKKAQDLGIAETNPTLDIEGYDTATKLIIICNTIFNKSLSLKDVNLSGISNLTIEEIHKGKTLGYKYKLIGTAKFIDNSLTLSVGLDKVYSNDPLYNVDGKNKAVKFVSDTLGEVTVIGGASGTTPAAAAILRDIINIEKGIDFTKF